MMNKASHQKGFDTRSFYCRGLGEGRYKPRLLDSPSHRLTEYCVIQGILLNMDSLSAMCDGKIIKIPRWEFIFRMCEDGAAWHLIPRTINPSSESFLGHIETGILCGG